MSKLLYRDLEQNEIDKILLDCGVKSVLTQNAKMKRSSKYGNHLYNFGIPALKSSTGFSTCPNAGNCAKGCYARGGAYVWSNVASAYEARLKLTKTKGFEEVIVNQVDKLIIKHLIKPQNEFNSMLYIRVHDSGDLYSKEYHNQWYSIAKAFLHETRVKFYAYTKMIQQSKELNEVRPSNFELIYSFGGKQDQLINIERDRHSKVFNSEVTLLESGYVDASHDDILALGPNKRIGLHYHGVKSWNNTNWNKVK